MRYVPHLIFVSLFGIFPAHALDESPKSIVVEHLETVLDGELKLTDHDGLTQSLSATLRTDRPTILNFVYYRCPGACTLLLSGLSEAIMETDFQLGADFDVVTVTVDPMESTELAAGKRSTYLKDLNKPGLDKAHWRFFTASRATITALTGQTGFGFEYDADTLQYIHPSVLIFVSPERTVSRYLYGSYFQPDNFDHALVESGKGTVGTLSQQGFTWLHDFGRPEIGRRYALNKARVAGLLVGIIGLGLGLVWIGLRRRIASIGPS